MRSYIRCCPLYCAVWLGVTMTVHDMYSLGALLVTLAWLTNYPCLFMCTFFLTILMSSFSEGTICLYGLFVVSGISMLGFVQG